MGSVPCTCEKSAAKSVPTEERPSYWIAHCHSACADGANRSGENRLMNASFDIEKAPFARGPFGFFIGD